MITVAASPSLAAAARQLERAAAEVPRDVADVNRAAAGWVRSEITGQARTRLDRAIASSVRVTAAGDRLSVTIADRRLSGGASTAQLAGPVEFGGGREHVTAYTGRSPRGRAYPVRRRTRRQLPAWTPKGRLAWAALPEIAARLSEQVTDAIRDAIEA